MGAECLLESHTREAVPFCQVRTFCSLSRMNGVQKLISRVVHLQPGWRDQALGYPQFIQSRRELAAFLDRPVGFRCPPRDGRVCYVRFFLLSPAYFFRLKGFSSTHRSSAISSSNWRHIRTTVHPIARDSASLSTVNVPTGLTAMPTRGYPSRFIPRSNSLAFHPMEMLYGVGSSDGTGTPSHSYS